MLSSHIASQIYKNFGFDPTPGQKTVVERLSRFIAEAPTDRTFILNGYAGTGKTTLVAALVRTLEEMGVPAVLLAPTGRAAKVMSRYAGRKAYTIHKKIYRQKTLASAESHFRSTARRKTPCSSWTRHPCCRTTPDGSLFGSGQLLDDLVTYVRRGAGCRLILVGDTAQLPPVGLEHSPALDVQHMQGYGEAEAVLLDDVVRQDSQSGILFNATLVRCMLEADIIDIPMFDTSFDDVEALEGGEILEAIQSAYDRYGMDETIIITRSNKRANRFNEAVRRHVLFAEEEIGSGDLLMIVKNNYHYTGKQQQQDRQENPEQQPGGTDFIANGDTAPCAAYAGSRISTDRFAQASLVFPDYDDMSSSAFFDTLDESPTLMRERE
ncbi:MAG: ATP-dependent RecD-like DNA helicase [Alistipes ihumii]